MAARLATAGVPILSITYAAALAHCFGLRSTRNLLLGVASLWLVVIAYFLPPGFPFPLFVVVFVIAAVGGMLLWLWFAFLLAPGQVEVWKGPASPTAILLVELRGGSAVIYQGDSSQVCVDRQQAVAVLEAKGASRSGDHAADIVSSTRRLRMLVDHW